MTWFKVDDKLHDHRKARAAGKAAMGLWVLAGSWSADNLTDGFVPASILPRWGSRADAAKLVTVGLWHPDEQDGEIGWRFHEWPERQPTRAEKLAERAARAEAGRKGGRASGASRREARGQAKAKQSASGLLEPPARPVPSRTAAAAAVPATPAEIARANHPSSGPEGPPLPPAVEILRSRLNARNLIVRWDKLTTDQLADIEELVARHGDDRLIRAALNDYRPGDPPRFAQAWLATWQAMPTATERLALVDPPCTRPGHQGTTRHCAQCASEDKAAER